MKIEKVPPLYLRVYQILKDEIVSGQFVPGESLVETKLAEQFDVSRTPIREAMRQLEKDGLITYKDSGTAIVYLPTVEDIADIYVTRATLEGQAASLTSILIADSDIQTLSDIISIAEEANSIGNIKKVVSCNTQFHKLLVELSQNETIIKTIESIHLLTVQVRRTSLLNSKQRSTSLEEHREIVEGLKGGESANLQRIVSQHILKAGKRLIQGMEIPNKPTPSIQFLLNTNED